MEGEPVVDRKSLSWTIKCVVSYQVYLLYYQGSKVPVLALKVPMMLSQEVQSRRSRKVKESDGWTCLHVCLKAKALHCLKS